MKQVPRIKGAYAEPFTERREDNAKTVESRNTIVAAITQNSYAAPKAYRNLRKNLREIQFSKGIV